MMMSRTSTGAIIVQAVVVGVGCDPYAFEYPSRRIYAAATRL